MIDEGPYGTVFGMITGVWVAQAVRAAAELGLAEHLADGPRTAAEVAAAAGIDADTGPRFLRTCAALGLVTRDGDRWAGTDLLAVLHDDHPESLRSFARSLGSGAMWRTWERFPEAVRSGELQAPTAIGASMFDHFTAHPQEGVLFSEGMVGVIAPVIRKAVEVIDAGSATTVVDVGGGHGSFVAAVLDKHPGPDGIVVDLPHTIPGAEALAAARGLTSRLTAVPGDFFKEVPGGDLMLLMFILHDWKDEDCVRILENCRAALHPGGRLVIVEMLVDHEPAGIAPLADIAMLTVAGSRERTLAEYDSLLTRAGLRRTAATPVHEAYHVIEAI